MPAHPVPTLTHSTSTATYELGHFDVEVTDTTHNGETKRSVRIADRSAKTGRGSPVQSCLDLDGPAVKDLAHLLGGLNF